LVTAWLASFPRRSMVTAHESEEKGKSWYSIVKPER
jgi:hypothetical protein